MRKAYLSGTRPRARLVALSRKGRNFLEEGKQALFQARREIVCWEVAGDPLKELNPNVNPAGSLSAPRASMMKKYRLSQAWRAKSFQAWEEAGGVKFNTPIVVSFRVYRPRKLDPDNALAGLKYLIDGLTTRRMQRPGLIPDDSADWVSYLPIEFSTGKQFSGPTAKVRICVSRKE